MKNPKTIAIVVAALALLAVGFLFFRGPKPLIEIKAEELAVIGPFPIVNTWVTSTLVMITVITIALLATRNLSMVPRGLQNAVEAIAEALYNICINTAGPEHGRRFFPVIMTIFTFIWIANWMALLPFFNAIGSFEKVDGHHFHEEAVVFTSTGPLSFIPLGQKEMEFEVDESEVAHVDDLVAELKAEEPGILDHDLDGRILPLLFEEGLIEEDTATIEEAKEHILEHAREESILEALHAEHLVSEDVHDLDEAYALLKEDGKKVGIIFPYFRSMNTDINSPLSIAIWAMIFIEFWGITALGVFKYAGKFLNFSSPINFFVGILEFIAEIARVISFTFRLFGNMLAGEILLLVMTFLVPFLVALPFYALETFVGVIQAFVFAMLTLVFGTLAVSSHEGHDEVGGHDDPDRPMEGPVPVMHA